MGFACSNCLGKCVSLRKGAYMLSAVSCVCGLLSMLTFQIVFLLAGLAYTSVGIIGTYATYRSNTQLLQYACWVLLGILGVSFLSLVYFIYLWETNPTAFRTLITIVAIACCFDVWLCIVLNSLKEVIEANGTGLEGFAAEQLLAIYKHRGLDTSKAPADETTPLKPDGAGLNL
eukprot:gnl/TRDRNA2_/TRDRNA2_181277_c0_seq1.p1 gnl/TRDRNA2_/TRDRNA2_181277_c0~~gnl/TRDRNA2_/TRDRNA2_181277_c0_seq1.p1  ORF type:complete len:174 (+),score=14.64 gnl/TRDRNA2_/TRDRNA2_181277_c0_seq1:156-677(+)